MYLYVIRFRVVDTIRIVCCMDVVAILQFSCKPDDIFKFSYFYRNEIFFPLDMTY